MLSLQNLGNASQARSYYERDNYYISGDPGALAESQWFGRGAEAVGLAGPVQADAFERVLAGQVPGGPQLGRIVDGELQHKPGIDLTFSAPKSVSVLAEVLNDNRLRGAHDAAVTATLAWVESQIVETRRFDAVTGKQLAEGDQRIVVALFRHDTSRELDPQLHTHAVIANMVLGADDKWRSLESASLYDNKMLTGLVYRSELAANLQELGYEVERTHADGRFEIRGFPSSLIEEFSTRSAQIREALAKFDHVTPELADRAAIMTRARKTEADRTELRASWRERAEARGHDLEAVRDSLMPDRLPPASLPGEAVERAVAELSERQSAFAREDLMRRVLAGSLGNARPTDIDAAIDKAIERGALVPASVERHEGYLTTPETVRLEAETIRLMQAGRIAVDPILGRRETAAMLSDRALTSGQRDAVETILGSVDRVVAVQGYAGTGKTTMLATVRELAERRGYSVLGLAPSSVAARTLGSETGIEAMTIQRFLSRNEDVLREAPAPDAVRDAARFFSGRILVLDEASMGSTRQMHDLLKLGERLDIRRIVLVGDAKQLNAVDAGKPFEQLQAAGMTTATMAEIMRQTTPEHREAVEHVIGAQIRAAFDKLDGRIVIAEKTELGVEAARRWLALPQQARETTLIVAPTHQLRSAINEHIRVGLKTEGRVGSSGIEVTTLYPLRLTTEELSRAQSYHPGERVLFNRNYDSLGIRRGQVAGVVSVNDRDGKIVLSVGGREVEWMPSRVAGRTPGAVELFEVRKLELARGDRIIWTRNDLDQRFLNSETATIFHADQNGIIIETQLGSLRHLKPDDRQLRHVDYAWGSTVYRSQGTTVNDVIAVMESRHPHLTTQKDFYVEISRARTGVTLVTENAARLQATLERQTGERIAALDIVAPEKHPEPLTAKREPELPRYVEPAQVRIEPEPPRLEPAPARKETPEKKVEKAPEHQPERAPSRDDYEWER